MRPETQQGSRRRRGGRRHRGPRTGPSSTSSRSGQPSSSARRSSNPEKSSEKVGFFQKIIAFFTGGKKAPRPIPGNVYGRVITDEPAKTSSSHTNANGRSSSTGSAGSAGSAGSSNAGSSTGSAGSGRSEGSTRSEGASRSAAAVESAPRPPKVVRKPELVEVTSPKLYVGNLSFDAAESDLAELFSGVGQVQSSEVVCHRETQRSKGFAFITMCTVEEARRAVSELHDKDYMGRRLVVSGAKTSDAR